MDANSAISSHLPGSCKFKARSNTIESDFTEVRILLTQAARLIASAIKEVPFPSFSKAAATYRADMLANGATWVGFAELLNFSWSSGIPVIHCPVKLAGKKPDGIAFKMNGRPVIALCKNAKNSAWLLFILAHELGHIALGHVDDNGMLLDATVNREDTESDEIAADRYATKLLTGKP